MKPTVLEMEIYDANNPKLKYKGYLEGHSGWITTMKVGWVTEGDTTKEFLVTGSRDNSIIVWHIEEKSDYDNNR